MNVLVTCPPMLGMIDEFRGRFVRNGVELTCPPVVQTLSESELISLVPDHEGWIIGDDPATRAVFGAGREGRLKAAVKWGVGVDNVDFNAAEELGIEVTNTPGMFGREVADIAMSYVIGLARQTVAIDRGVRAGEWPKPSGLSLADKTVALVGYGDIGRNIAQRLLAADMKVCVYDPALDARELPGNPRAAAWPAGLGDADFLVFACALTEANRHMFNRRLLGKLKPGLRLVNVSRGGLIDEQALIEGLQSGVVHSAALDVFEQEPLGADSPLRGFEACIFGSHNASNTVDAVRRTTDTAIKLLFGFLNIS